MLGFSCPAEFIPGEIRVSRCILLIVYENRVQCGGRQPGSVDLWYLGQQESADHLRGPRTQRIKP